jgi:hypothetical protein
METLAVMKGFAMPGFLAEMSFGMVTQFLHTRSRFVLSGVR